MATELAEGIHWFELTGVNAYLVEDDVLTLVDAGTPFDAHAIETGIQDAGHTVGDIERVLLTHYDFDHAGALARLSDLDATIRAGAADAAVLTGERKPPGTTTRGCSSASRDRSFTRRTARSNRSPTASRSARSRPTTRRDTRPVTPRS